MIISGKNYTNGLCIIPHRPYITNPQKDALWEGQGCKFDALWEGQGRKCDALWEVKGPILHP